MNFPTHHKLTNLTNSQRDSPTKQQSENALSQRSGNKRDIPVSVSSPVTAILYTLPAFPRETAPFRVFSLTETLPRPTVELCVCNLQLEALTSP